MRHSVRGDLRAREPWRGLDGESYERAVATLSAYLAYLHTRGDWSDVPAAARRRQAKLRKAPRLSRALAHGFGVALRRDLTRNERARLNGVELWAKVREFRAKFPEACPRRGT